MSLPVSRCVKSALAFVVSRHPRGLSSPPPSLPSPVLPGSPLMLIASESPSSAPSEFEIVPVFVSVNVPNPEYSTGAASVAAAASLELGTSPSKASNPIVGPPKLVIVPLLMTTFSLSSASLSK